MQRWRCDLARMQVEGKEAGKKEGDIVIGQP
jgi:hypothetical protein